jgi:hypothetical protein
MEEMAVPGFQKINPSSRGAALGLRSSKKELRTAL